MKHINDDSKFKRQTWWWDPHTLVGSTTWALRGPGHSFNRYLHDITARVLEMSGLFPLFLGVTAAAQIALNCRFFPPRAARWKRERGSKGRWREARARRCSMPTTSTRSASSTKSSMSSTTWLTEPSISASSSVFVSSSSPFTSHFARCVSFTFQASSTNHCPWRRSVWGAGQGKLF